MKLNLNIWRVRGVLCPVHVARQLHFEGDGLDDAGVGRRVVCLRDGRPVEGDLGEVKDQIIHQKLVLLKLLIICLKFSS